MNMKKTVKLLKFVAIFALIAAFLSLPAQAATLSDVDNVPYESYTYWQGYSPKKALPTKNMYEVDRVLEANSFGNIKLNTPGHIICDPNGEYLYVLDSGNGRIVQLSLSDYSFVREITSVLYNGEQLSFKDAKGIYIDKKGQIYICDTSNGRIIILNNNYEVTALITSPEEQYLPDGFTFKPIRVVVDNKDFTYILSEGCYYGALAYDENLNFKSFFGANIVPSDILGTIRSLFTSIFQTNEKMESSLQKLPSEFTDICISEDGFLFTVSSNDNGQLRKLGPKGSNNLKYSFATVYSNADSFNFGDNEPRISRGARLLNRTFSSMTINSDGFIYLVDNLRCRIYMYDEDCQLLGVFGGGFGIGEQQGTFQNSNAIVAVDDRLLILDSIRGTVTVMKATEYGKTLMKADSLTLKGRYEEAEPYWKQVLSEDKNCQIAYSGLSKAMYVSGNYTDAMKYSKEGLDVSGYAQAFSVASNDYLKDNVWWIALIGLAALGALTFFMIYTKRRELVLIKNDKLRTAFSLTTHPFAASSDIKNKGRGSILIATIFIAMYFLMSVFSVLYGGFMHVGIEKENINILFTFLGTVGVVLLWIISNWGVCILTEGKGKLKEIYCASAYCLLPSIIGMILFMLLSHVVVASDFSSLGVMTTLFNGYTIILLLVSMTVIHDFSFFKSLGTAVISLFGMVLCAFVIFVVFMLMQDFAGFIVGIFREVLFR